MSAPDNPPAFPSHWMEDNGFGMKYPAGNDGMTLRDHFAGQAVTIFPAPMPHDMRPEQIEQAAKFIASMSYRIADAMLVEREQDRSATRTVSGFVKATVEGLSPELRKQMETLVKEVVERGSVNRGKIS